MNLLPGTHLCELVIREPVSQRTVEDALSMIGFEDVVFDAVPSRKDKDDQGEWAEGDPKRDHDHGYFRFVGRTRVALQIEPIEGVSWPYAHTLSVDPYEAKSLDKNLLFQLRKGVPYDLFFASWLKTAGGRTAVVQALQSMRGFYVEKTACMKSLMRFPDRAGADGSLWVATGRWEGADSMIVSEDPLFFYAAKEVLSSNS